MASWVDVEFLVTRWYHEADCIAWCDVWAVESDLDDLNSIEPTSNKERYIIAEMTMDLQDQLAIVFSELRPQLRLATADMRARKSLRW